jgi:hypothetical protein
MRFQVIIIVRKKMNVFRAITLTMEAISTSETLANFYQTAWLNIPEDSHLQFCLSEMI